MSLIVHISSLVCLVVVSVEILLATYLLVLIAYFHKLICDCLSSFLCFCVLIDLSSVSLSLVELKNHLGQVSSQLVKQCL